MAIVIDEILTETAPPATPLQGQPVVPAPADAEADARRIAAAIRRREARAARLRAD